MNRQVVSFLGPLAGRGSSGLTAVASSVAVVLIGLLTSCSGPPSAPAQAAAGYDAGRWPQRPRVDLSFSVADDLHSATGRETVVFTPDLRTCDLVFRAWPNDPSEARSGASLLVTDTTVDGHPAAPQVSSAGAAPGAPGTLIDIPLSTCLNPGQSVTAALGFRLTLGADSGEVLGYSTKSQAAWFATGYPLLAWVRGTGWARDPALALDGDGDFPTSEDYQLALSVTAPSRYRVTGTGAPAGEGPGPGPGTTTHRFTAPAVRDVTVGVGQYTVLDRDLNGVTLHLATPEGDTGVDPSAWADQVSDAVTSLSAIFGPFPYPQLWVTVIPGQDDGQEYPGALQLGDHIKQKRLRSLIAHEVSHEWFYALVGDNQAENPWLDEGLATFGEALVGGDANDYQYSDTSRKVVGLMGQPLSYFATHGGSDRYDDAVYNQGAAVLLEARRRVGADAFDAALRGYLLHNAHRVATPSDFARAFAGLPAVLDLLRQAGALSAAPSGTGH